MLGERIRSARIMRGLSQRELARRVGVSAMAISKYERNLDIPGSEVLLKLAKALGVHIEFFLRSERIRGIVPAYRKRKALPRKLQASIVEQVREWLERYVALENLFFEDSPQFQLPEGWPRSIRDLEEIEEAAIELRQAWNLGIDPIENLAELLEDHGIKIGVMDVQHEAFDALAFRYDGNPVIVVRRHTPGDRERFNLAHELAHLVLAVEEDLDIERVANRFAGAFLAPEPVVFQELGIHRKFLHPFELYLLKHKYGLSMQAWVYRARDLGIISRSTASRIFQHFRKQGWHRAEPGDPYPFEEPQRMERLVLRALAEGLISKGRAEELLGKSLEPLTRQVKSLHGGAAPRVRV